MTSEQHLPLAGKVALITGSSQGIGLATAQRLARNGADIVINYRSNVTGAESAKATIEELGRRCLAIKADVSQEEDVARLFTQTHQSLGAITILVNNPVTTVATRILRLQLAD